jgi:hypothetical protein
MTSLYEQILLKSVNGDKKKMKKLIKISQSIAGFGFTPSTEIDRRRIRKPKDKFGAIPWEKNDKERLGWK